MQKAGEAPNPADFSIMGKVTDTVNGNPLTDVAVLLDTTEVIVLADEQGNYILPIQPSGNYTLSIYKSGYKMKSIPVAVVAGTVVAVNAVLETEEPTGSVQGQVFQAGTGVGAKISVMVFLAQKIPMPSVILL